jgi:hypothetical protein
MAGVGKGRVTVKGGGHSNPFVALGSRPLTMRSPQISATRIKPVAPESPQAQNYGKGSRGPAGLPQPQGIGTPGGGLSGF